MKSNADQLKTSKSNPESKPNAKDNLKALADKQGIKNTIFAIDNVAGPPDYQIAKEADITVVLYNKRKIEANHAFKKGELDAKAVEAILEDLKKILPEKKSDK